MKLCGIQRPTAVIASLVIKLQIALVEVSGNSPDPF